MRVLHTSDWHLGHKFHGRTRHDEFNLFLQWLEDNVTKYAVDALIVAGDIFDSQTPSNRSLTMYYGFLSRMAHSCCRHIIIVGGNHDSPALLNAPRELLTFLNIHVVPCVSKDLEDELIILHDGDHKPEAIVLAVPYLRDKDIRTSVSRESPDEKQHKLIQGIHDHYANLIALAREKQKEIQKKIPLIAIGHLFCQGGKTRQGDGIRELYVGTLLRVGIDCFPSDIDYLALGHLHLPQKIGKQYNRRYSGAPLPMNFSEGGETKNVLLVDFLEEITIEEIPVPCFQQLQSISGNLHRILQDITDLAATQQSTLIEIHYLGEELIDDLQEKIASAVEGTELEVLRISNKRIYNHTLQQSVEIKTLDELSPQQVFQQCLDQNDILPEQRQELLLDFDTTLNSLINSEPKG